VGVLLPLRLAFEGLADGGDGLDLPFVDDVGGGRGLPSRASVSCRMRAAAISARAARLNSREAVSI